MRGAGMLFPPRDVDACAQAIDRLLDDGLYSDDLRRASARSCGRADVASLGRSARTRLRPRPRPEPVRRLPACACSSTSLRCRPGLSGRASTRSRSRTASTRGDVELHLLTRRTRTQHDGRLSPRAQSCTPTHRIAVRCGSRGNSSARPSSHARYAPTCGTARTTRCRCARQCRPSSPCTTSRSSTIPSGTNGPRSRTSGA